CQPWLAVSIPGIVRAARDHVPGAVTHLRCLQHDILSLAHPSRSNDMNTTSSQRVKKTPGPDHPITVERTGKRVVVKIGGRTVADTRDALTLKEANYPAVQYIPRKDVDMAQLARTDHATYCPYKGECSYYSISDA